MSFCVVLNLTTSSIRDLISLIKNAFIALIAIFDFINLIKPRLPKFDIVVTKSSTIPILICISLEIT